MIPAIRKFERLSIEFPEKEIFLRLGGNCFKTTIDKESRTRYNGLSRKLFALCEPQGRFITLPISEIHANGVETADGFLELGTQFCSRAANAAALWCGAVTIGKTLPLWRDNASSIAESAIADAVGSECADAAMDTLCKISGTDLRRAGSIMDTRRFSPGYGDMPLALQQFLYRKLEMSQMGITLDQNNFLLPEKSVTAFAFIHSTQENQP